MAIEVIDGFRVFKNQPIDIGRRVVNDTTERDAISNDVRYIGLKTFVISENKEYQLQNGITNSDWVDVTAGGNLSFQNGLTKVGNDIKLGGDLTEFTFINGGANGLIKLFETIGDVNRNSVITEDSLNHISAFNQLDNNTLDEFSSSFSQSAKGISIVVNKNFNGFFGISIIEQENLNKKISFGNFDNVSGLLEGIYFDKTDNRFKATSTNLTPTLTELITYENLTTALNNITASNGLTKVGDNIKLGGSLTNDTIIDGNSFSLTEKYNDAIEDYSLTAFTTSWTNSYTFDFVHPSFPDYINHAEYVNRAYHSQLILSSTATTTSTERHIGIYCNNDNISSKKIQLGEFFTYIGTSLKNGIYYDSGSTSFHIQAPKANNVITNTEIPAWQNVINLVDDKITYYAHTDDTVSGDSPIVGIITNDMTFTAILSPKTASVTWGYSINGGETWTENLDEVALQIALVGTNTTTNSITSVRATMASVTSPAWEGELSVVLKIKNY